jgi:peptidoglycan/LPS O-acetylase OafA/YrhL
MSVLIYHLFPGRLPGGYIGVDVFFVISGYLIGSQLAREAARTGRIRLASFWARRARRLLPASCLVLATTAISVLVWVPEGLWPQFLREIATSTLYIQNWQLAADSVDYLALSNMVSPVQHFWTLSTEEQFYIATPLLLIIGVAVARRRRPGSERDRMRTTMGVFLAMTLASFAYSLYLTWWSAPAAYFSTLTRAWEFSVGALVFYLPAVGAAGARRLGVGVGLAAIAASTVLYSSDTVFPGIAAVLPVGGAVAVLWFGKNPTALASVGAMAPVALLGEVSYSLYLWHWPLIVLVPYISGHGLTRTEKLAVLVTAVGLACLSTKMWENPIRFSPRLLGNRRARTIAAWTGGGMLVVLGIAGGGFGAVAVDQRIAGEHVDALLAERPACLGAAAIAEPDCVNSQLEGTLIPDPVNLVDEVIDEPDCFAESGADPTLKVCVLGHDTGYSKRIFAVGDSHAKAIQYALDDIANEYGWRIDIASRSGCYWTAVEVTYNGPESIAGCREWRRRVSEFIDRTDDLDAVLLARRRGMQEVAVAPGETKISVIVDGIAQAISQRADQSIPVMILVDNPQVSKDTVTCVDRYGLEAAEKCAFARSRGFALDDGAYNVAAAVEGVSVVDLTHLYCDDALCFPVIGNVIVYRDTNHITKTYASTMAPYLGSEMQQILSGR